jgi:hypothetical protein
MFKINVPGGERLVRGVAAFAMVAGGVWWALSGQLLWGGLLAASGLGLGLTAVTGWCPMCAAVGRTLPEVDRKVTVARL